MTPKKNPDDYEKRGVPTIYTEELGAYICEKIATHPIGYEHIKKIFPELPASITLREWRLKHPEFAARYLAAKSLQAQILVEEADEMIPSEILYYYDDKGNQRVDSPSASLVIAKINNRKWAAARLAPKVYGDKSVEALREDSDRIKQELQEVRDRLDKENKKEY